MLKHWKYLKYVLRHKWYVFVYCLQYGLIWQGIVHDLSKFRRSEWLPYANYFYGNIKPAKDIPLGPLAGLGIFPYTAEDAESDFDRAWNHHQKRNPHHWQYWVLLEDDGGVKCLEMPLRYAKEMIADWKGAGMALGKPDTRAWYLENRHKIKLHQFTRYYVEDQLHVLFTDPYNLPRAPIAQSLWAEPEDLLRYSDEE